MAEVSYGDTELLEAAEKGDYSAANHAIKDLKADVNCIESKTGSTPLHYAVRSGKSLLVRLLLVDRKARYDIEDKQKRTALALARELGNNAVLEVFAQANALPPTESVPADALVGAATAKDAERVKELLAKQASGRIRIDLNYQKPPELRTALHVAAATGHRPICELLITAKASMEKKDRNGQTPLFSAQQFKRVNIIELLLSAGANVDARNNHGFTALHKACIDGTPEVISAFFSKSAVMSTKLNLVELPSATGQTPLFSAARSFNPANVKLLLKEYKANAAARDQSGDTALHKLCTDVVPEQRRSARLDTLRAMLTLGCPMEAKNHEGQTPLYKAILAPAKDLVECLLQAGANLRTQDSLAVKSQAVEAEAIVDVILKGSVDVNVQNAAGATPLDLAVSETIRTKLRAYTPPAPPAPLPTVAPVVAVPKKVNPIPAPKRKGSENEILVDGEDDEEEGEVRPIAKSASISSSQEKRPRREHSWQKQGSSKSAASATDSSGKLSSGPLPTPLVRTAPGAAVVGAATRSPAPIPAAASHVVEPTEVKADTYIAFEPMDTRPPVATPASASGAKSSSSVSSTPANPVASPKLSSSSPYVNLRDDAAIDPQRAASLGPVIEFNELQLGDVIGEGAFGAVHKGEWNLMPVAVKVLHKSDPKAQQMFFKEVELFNKIRHKHIARYLGSCISPPRLCMVMEFYPHSLMSMIAGHPLDIATLLHIAHGVALAMLHLHSRKIIHRDIKPSNILLDEHSNPYVADFGVSREYGQPGTMTGIGTPLYMAPEMLTTKKYSEKVDQYAFAMLLWQMLTGKSIAKGFHDGGDDDEEVTPIQIAFRAATQKWRPTVPARAPAELRQLIEACWDHSPEARPGFDKIASALQAIMVQYPRQHHK